MSFPVDSSSAGSADRSACFLEAIEQIGAIHDPASFKRVIHTELKNILGLAEKNQAYDFEVKLAEQSGVPVDEVVGLSRNFHNDVTTDGSLGVFKIRDVAFTTPTVNLVNAYKNGMETIKPGEITWLDIRRLRGDAEQFLMVRKDQQAIPKIISKPPALAHAKGSVEGKFPPEVQERMKKYGLELEATEGSQVKFKYTRDVSIKDLQDFTEQLNAMVNSGMYTPEFITSYAVQELLIMHPFKDGNGRTARLLGQILYKKLTGKTIVFPEAFHQELNFGCNDLSDSLLRLTNQKIPTLEDRYRPMNYTERSFGKTLALPKVVELEPSKRAVSVPEKPFPDFVLDGTKMKYAELPVDMKQYQGPVFYGKPEKSEESALNTIKTLFNYGRTNRGEPHYDVLKQVESTKVGQKSGFFSTSSKLSSALTFAVNYGVPSRESYGVVFIIDPRGKEILNLPKLTELYHPLTSEGDDAKRLMKSEGEILFADHLDPKRIVGAIILDTKLGGASTASTKKILLNPNYKPSGPRLDLTQVEMNSP